MAKTKTIRFKEYKPKLRTYYIKINQEYKIKAEDEIDAFVKISNHFYSLQFYIVDPFSRKDILKRISELDGIKIVAARKLKNNK